MRVHCVANANILPAHSPGVTLMLHPIPYISSFSFDASQIKIILQVGFRIMMFEIVR
jgi:hypothetical protein